MFDKEKTREALLKEVHKLRELVKQLEEKDRMLDQFARLSLDMICIAGFDGFFKRLNPVWEKTLGYSIPELMSKPYIEFVHPEDREKTVKEAERLSQTTDQETVIGFENRYLAKDGSHKWFDWKAISIFDQQVIYAIARDATERKANIQELERMSLLDKLTGLYNKRGFHTHAESYLRFSIRKKMGLLLFIVDLDGLKKINDTYGHKEGDWALIKAAEIFRGTFRESDIIARIGGDEFAILAIEAWKDSMGILMKRLHERIHFYNKGEDPPYKLSFSIGVSHFDPKNPISFEALISQADTMLYQQKKSKSRI